MECGEGPRVESAGGELLDDLAPLRVMKLNSVKTEAEMALKRMDIIYLWCWNVGDGFAREGGLARTLGIRGRGGHPWLGAIRRRMKR
jgi:hypothetical protein